MDDGREVEESLVAFGRHLRTARLRRGLSQAGVAAMAGVSQRTLQKLEAGDPGVALRTAGAVMLALGFGLPFEGLCSPETDETGRLQDMERVPKRGRRRRRFGTVDVEGAGGEDDAGDSGEEPSGPSM